MNINFRVHNEEAIFFYIFGFRRVVILVEKKQSKVNKGLHTVHLLLGIPHYH